MAKASDQEVMSLHFVFVSQFKAKVFLNPLHTGSTCKILLRPIS